MTKNSKVWEYFSESKKEKARCKKCETDIGCKGSSTSAMISHLKTHKIFIHNDNSDDENSNRVQTNLLRFVKKVSLAEIISRCLAEDGFSFHGILKSKAIKGYVQEKGYLFPQSISTLSNLLSEFYEEKLGEYQKLFEDLKNKGKRFSISTDEWTANNLKRYLCVNVYCEQNYFIGLQEINGSCTSEVIRNLVENKLRELNIDLNVDVVASTHDGASVMKKYGKYLPCISQLCLNHAIHLAIMDSFYRDKADDDALEESSDEEDSENLIEKRNLIDNCTIDSNIQLYNEIASKKSLTVNLDGAVKKLRKLVKFFRKSPLRNNILQDNVKAKFGSEKRLQLDCPTRWNSLIVMIERYLEIKDAVRMTTAEFEHQNLSVEEENILESFMTILKPIELAIIELSKNETNLLHAEAVFLFIEKTLSKIQTPIATKILESMFIRINERRNCILVTSIMFLNSGIIPNNTKYIHYCTERKVKEYLSLVFSRHFPYRMQSENSSEAIISSVIAVPSLYETLQSTISSLEVNIKDSQDDMTTLLNDLKIFEATRVRTEKVEKLFQALLTIRPTSTVCERVFSVSGNFNTKLRASLKYKTLNNLVFLKYYFLNE